MELLLTIAFIIVIALLFVIRSNQKDAERRNELMFKSLKKDLQELKENAGQKQPSEKMQPQKPDTPASEEVVQWRPYIPPPVEKITAPKKEEKAPEPAEEKIAAAVEPVKEEIIIRPALQPAPPAESWWQRWVRNNPDMEKFVGENLANKIGIAVLVLGIAFFVKYAIDQEWIGKEGRVAMASAAASS
jgi:uncharacterized membrane protein